MPLAPLERLDDSTAVKFRNEFGVEISCTEAVPKAAYAELGAAFPGAMRYEALRQRICRRLGGEGRLDAASESKLVRALLLSDVNGVVEMHAEPPPFATEISPMPKVSPMARLQAEREVPISVLNASAVMAADRSVRALLLLLDGSRDRTRLLEAWRQRTGAERPTRPEVLERTLRLLAHQGLLVT
jgi:hypothetical protein